MHHSRPTSFRYACVIVVLLACHGHASSDASVDKNSDQSKAKHSKETGAAAGGATGSKLGYVEHQVSLGETLWDIARAYHVRIADIMRFNGISSGKEASIREGKKLKIPGASKTAKIEKKKMPEPVALTAVQGKAAYHTLEPGETLWDLSRSYDVAIDKLLAANQLKEDKLHLLREGQQIVVPGLRPTKARRAKKRKVKRGPGVRHRMAPGETVWDLARNYGVSVAEIMAANRLNPQSVTKLRNGEELTIPGVRRSKSGKVRRDKTPSERRATRLGRRLGLGTRQAASKLLSGRLRRSWIRAAGGSPKRFPGTLRWPVTKGWFTRGYGSGEGGYHQAVDIMGNIGWNVRSAAPGIVGYSGRGVRGYGNLVLVIHSGGWVTMYAHNSVNFVVAGQRVDRGTVLAEVGSTGISRGPHVHFELIHQGKSCDPGPLFRPGIRHRSGKRSKVRSAVWRADAPPSSVPCNRRRRHPRSRWVSHEKPSEN